MHTLELHHITDVYVLVSELLPKTRTPTTGRPALLSPAELITLLVWNTLTVKSQTLKDVHSWVLLYHKDEFPKVPKYNGFLMACQRVIPQLIRALEATMATDSPVRFLDSTMLEVCKLVRADQHKVAKNWADFGKNHQGWHYGFKLHAGVNPKGQLTSVVFSKASVHDAQVMPKLVNEHTRVAVGDSHYGASVMGRIINKKFGTIIIAPPHYKQNRKLLTAWQYKLLHLRQKVECLFDYLKNHLHLVSSFSRSIAGYFLHYLRILLSYQIMHI